MYKILLIEPNNTRYDNKALDNALGGSETVFLFLVDSLKKRGDVDLEIVFKNDPQFGGQTNHDLIISYRDPSPFLHVQGKINACLFQDMPGPQSSALISHLMQAGRLNRLIFLSHFQKEAYLQNISKELVHEARHCYMFENGLNMGLFSQYTMLDIPHSLPKEMAFIYASAPNRGLDVLLDMWPVIHNLLPDYTLKIAGGVTMYNVPGNDTNDERVEFLSTQGEDLYDRARTMDGVELLGPIPHRELIRQFEVCTALLYPNTFPETSCHVLNAALHAGCCPITSQMGALVEKIVHGENGFLIPADPTTDQYKQLFVQTLMQNLQSGTIERINKTNRGTYLGFDMDRLTDRLINIFLNFRKLEGDNHRILAVCPSLYGNNKKQFANWRWYSPVDVQTDELVGMPIDHARNVAANIAVHKEADWLLFIDDDNYTAPNFVMDMIDTAIKRNVQVVVCNYYFKEDAGLIPVARVYRKCDYKAVDIIGLTEEEVNGPDYHFVMAGLGACLIHTNALKQIGRPYFRTQCVQVRHTGEDSFFFQECHRLNIPMWLSLDIPVIHVGKGKVYGKQEHIDKVVGTLI